MPASLSSKILCLSATQTNFPHLSNDKKYNIIARNKENQKTESFSGTYNNDWSFSIFQLVCVAERHKILLESSYRPRAIGVQFIPSNLLWGLADMSSTTDKI